MSALKTWLNLKYYTPLKFIKSHPLSHHPPTPFAKINRRPRINHLVNHNFYTALEYHRQYGHYPNDTCSQIPGVGFGNPHYKVLIYPNIHNDYIIGHIEAATDISKAVHTYNHYLSIYYPK